MIRSFSTYFVASAGASAAFIGLLFVAMAIEKGEQRDAAMTARRRALSDSSYNHLLNIFFVSLVGLLGEVRLLGGVSVLMAALCLWNISQVLPGVVRTGNWAARGSWRHAAVVLPVTSILMFAFQILMGILLLIHPASALTLRVALLTQVGTYAGALARAWYIPKN